MPNYWTQQENRMYGGQSGEDIQRMIDAANAMQVPQQTQPSGIDYALLASAMSDTAPEMPPMSNPAFKGMTGDLGKLGFNAISGSGAFSPSVQGAQGMMASSGVDVPLYAGDIGGMNPGTFSQINPFAAMLGASGDIHNPYSAGMGSALGMAGNLLGPGLLGPALSSVFGGVGFAALPIGEMISMGLQDEHALSKAQQWQADQLKKLGASRVEELRKQGMSEYDIFKNLKQQGYYVQGGKANQIVGANQYPQSGQYYELNQGGYGPYWTGGVNAAYSPSEWEKSIFPLEWSTYPGQLAASAEIINPYTLTGYKPGGEIPMPSYLGEYTSPAPEALRNYPTTGYTDWNAYYSNMLLESLKQQQAGTMPYETMMSPELTNSLIQQAQQGILPYNYTLQPMRG